MTYQFPVVPRDKFESDQSGGFAEPCCWCVHRHNSDSEEPCRTCDHNSNAVPDDEDGDQICPTCSGSGEGMYDGTTCSSCRGKGVA